MSQHPSAPRPHKAIPVWVAAMPAYTLGLLAPAPLLYAAVRHPIRSLQLITAGYGAAWLAAWILATTTRQNSAPATAAGGLFVVLALACTAHAFVLRESLSASSAVGEQLAPPPPAPAADSTQAMLGQATAALTSLTSYVTAHAAQLPPTCKQLFDDTVAQLLQVIRFVAGGGHADAELRAVHAMVTDYLPTSLHGYLRLPQDYATTQRNPDGRTAAEELQLQLGLLRDNATETARSTYRDDALGLEDQSAVLQSKFGTSELDLP